MEYITFETIVAVGSIVLLLANLYVMKKGDDNQKARIKKVNTVFNETVKLFEKVDNLEKESNPKKSAGRPKKLIYTLGLPVRVETALVRNNINYVSELREMKINDIRLLRGIGEMAVDAITKALKNK